MSDLSTLIEELCDVVEELNPDWEECSTCRPVIPYLRANKNSMSITPMKIRVRSVMRKLKYLSIDKYNELNDRFRRLNV
jgi:hypothetical protein